MFCSHCGSQVPDGAAFCAACGTPANGQGAPVQTAAQPTAPAAPVAPAAPAAPGTASVMFKDFLGMVKGFFSKDVMKTVGAEAKSTGKEWIVAIALSVLVFALAMTVNVIQLVTGEVFSMLSFLGITFIKVFGINLLIGLLTAGATFGAVWLLMTVFFKKKVPVASMLNLVGMVTIPLTVCQIANMLFGLVWFPLVIVASVVAAIMAILMLYVGIQKMEKLDSSPFFAFNLGMVIVIVVAGLAAFLLYKGLIGSALGSAVGGLLGGMSGLGSSMSGLSGLGGMSDLGGMMDMF